MSASLCLADADVLIDGAKYGFLEPFFETPTIGVASTAYAEVRFFRDERDGIHPINLQPAVTAGKLTVVYGTAPELQRLYAHSVSTRLGVGELEALSLVANRGFTFCTADQLALKTMLDLGLYDRWGLGYFIHRESQVLQKLTRGGLGTEYYCSLEQWATGKCDARGDIYSLGMTLDEWVTGRQRHINVGDGLGSDCVPAVTPGARHFNDLLRHMTQRSKGHRPVSMQLVAGELRMAAGS